MSQISRKAVIISAAVALIAIAGGLTAFFMLKDRGAAAVVNGVKITVEKVEEESAKAVTQYAAQGMELQPEQLDQIRTTILDNLIMREVLLQESSALELTEEEVEEKIESFRTRFEDEAQFIEALSQQGHDMESFRTVIAEDLRIQKMIDETVGEVTEVSDEQIKTFYDENPSYFTQPERVHASHILVSLEDKTTEEEKADAVKKIERIREELLEGADFAEMAKAESEGPSGPNGGDLGEFTRGQMVSGFETVAFTLPPGEISGVVETQFGYHIIKVHERFPESSVPLDEVKDSISSFLLQDLNQQNLNQYLEDLKESANIRIIPLKG